MKMNSVFYKRRAYKEENKLHEYLKAAKQRAYTLKMKKREIKCLEKNKALLQSINTAREKKQQLKNEL